MHPGLTFTRKGFTVIGFDVDETKIPLLNKGKSYVKHIKAEEIAEAVNAKLGWEAKTDLNELVRIMVESDLKKVLERGF